MVRGVRRLSVPGGDLSCWELGSSRLPGEQQPPHFAGDERRGAHAAFVPFVFCWGVSGAILRSSSCGSDYVCFSPVGLKGFYVWKC